MSKASKGRLWFENKFVDMRTVDIAYRSTLESLAGALSADNVDWLLGSVAGWKVVLNTPIECIVGEDGEIVGKHELWNCAEKTRWMADREFYGDLLTKAYVEHPYEKQYTKAYIIEGVKAALKRGLSTRTITDQVKEIVDARLDCVLLPSSSNPKSSHAHESIRGYLGNKLDGMVAKYSEIKLVDHDTASALTKADLKRADDDMKRRVTVAMVNLTGNLKWVFPGSSVAASRKPKARVPKAKAIKATPTLQRVTWADFEIALISLGWSINRPTSSNKRDSGWHGVFKSVRHKAALPSGDFVTQGKRFLLAQIDRADFERAVNTLVQQRMKVVY